MTTFNDLWSQIKKSFPLNKTSIVLLILLLSLMVWGTFRACSTNSRLDKSRVFTIARDPTWYPLNLMGKEKKLLAFTNDLILAIAKDEKLRVELISNTADTLFRDLDDGDYDAIISSLIPNSFSRHRYLFSDPLYLIGPVLIVPQDSKATSIKDMDNRSVGIKRGMNLLTDTHQYRIYYVPYDSMTIAFDDLYRDRIDGILLPILEAHTYTQSFYAGQIKIVTPPLTKEGVRIIATKNPQSEYFIEKFNKGMKLLKDNGTYDQLLAKWGLVNSDVNSTIIPLPTSPSEANHAN